MQIATNYQCSCWMPYPNRLLKDNACWKCVERFECVSDKQAYGKYGTFYRKTKCRRVITREQYKAQKSGGDKP